MKLLTFLSLFFLVSSPAFAVHVTEEEDANEVVNRSMKIMMKCDSSGMESAKLAMGFTRLMMVGSAESQEVAMLAAGDIDAIVAGFESSKTCEEYRVVYGKILDFARKYESFDLEAELAKPEAKEFLKQFAGSLKEQLK